jgi:hypothetical protein
MKKRGNILAENIIFIILNLAFIGIIVLFIFLKTGDAAVLEEVYAKQIALMIDAAKPEMKITLNIEEGIVKLAKEKNKKQEELLKEEIESIVKIKNNIVTVKIRQEEGRDSSYSFFNNLNVTSPVFNKEKSEIYFTTRAFEKPITIQKVISYAKDNAVKDRQCNCGDECENYANLILKYANENGIDSILLLSLMMQESSCDKTVSSDSSVGLMRINPAYHCGKYGLSDDETECRNQLLTNVELNINAAAQILKEYYNTYSGGLFFDACAETKKKTYYYWDAALRKYNGSGCNSAYPAQDNFVEDINERYNLLKEVK